MGPPENFALAVVGASVIGTVWFFGMRTVRRVERRVEPETEAPLRGLLTYQRPELPAPPRKEIEW